MAVLLKHRLDPRLREDDVLEELGGIPETPVRSPHSRGWRCQDARSLKSDIAISKNPVIPAKAGIQAVSVLTARLDN